MTPEIIENLEVLLAAVEAQPENLFDLGSWRTETPCGTNFCVAGLACSMPRFQAAGMRWTTYDVPQYNGIDMRDDGGDELFGANSMPELFRFAGGGRLDKELGLDYGYDDYDDVHMYCTDKELAVARLKNRIATYKGEK